VVAAECHHITWATPVLAKFSRSNVSSGTFETYDHGLKNSICGAISEYDGQAGDMTTARARPTAVDALRRHVIVSLSKSPLRWSLSTTLTLSRRGWQKQTRRLVRVFHSVA
jgi:hypothetical protein